VPLEHLTQRIAGHAPVVEPWGHHHNVRRVGSRGSLRPRLRRGGRVPRLHHRSPLRRHRRDQPRQWRTHRRRKTVHTTLLALLHSNWAAVADTVTWTDTLATQQALSRERPRQLRTA